MRKQTARPTRFNCCTTAAQRKAKALGGSGHPSRACYYRPPGLHKSKSKPGPSAKMPMRAQDGCDLFVVFFSLLFILASSNLRLEDGKLLYQRCFGGHLEMCLHKSRNTCCQGENKLKQQHVRVWNSFWLRPGLRTLIKFRKNLIANNVEQPQKNNSALRKYYFPLSTPKVSPSVERNSKEGCAYENPKHKDLLLKTQTNNKELLLKTQ